MASHSEPAGGGVDWEARYRAGDTPWDKGMAHPALAAWAQRLNGRVLVPGCGLGHDVRAIAAQADTVVGLDIARRAVEAAGKYPGSGKETYVLGDLFDPPEEWRGTFDGVFEHTCFCAINPRQREDYVKSVHQLLKPDGRLLSIFYVDPGVEEGPPFGCSSEELRRLFSPYFDFMEECRDLSTYEGREGRELLQIWQRKP